MSPTPHVLADPAPSRLSLFPQVDSARHPEHVLPRTARCCQEWQQEWQQRRPLSILPLMELLRLEKGEGPGSFRLIGELDNSNVLQVTTRLQAKLREADQLTLNASDLTFMDVQGLRMLIELGEEAAKRETSVTLINCSRQIKRLLDVAVPTGIPGVEIVEGDK